MKKQQGFTLIELIVVIVILGILGAIALPKFVNIAGDARTAVIKGVAGSMAASNAMIYSKAALTPGALGAGPTAVTINGAAVSVVFGFAATSAAMLPLLDLNPATDFNTATANQIRHAFAATVGATCAVTYTPATATLPPVYTINTTTC